MEKLTPKPLGDPCPQGYPGAESCAALPCQKHPVLAGRGRSRLVAGSDIEGGWLGLPRPPSHGAPTYLLGPRPPSAEGFGPSLPTGTA